MWDENEILRPHTCKSSSISSSCGMRMRYYVHIPISCILRLLHVRIHCFHSPPYTSNIYTHRVDIYTHCVDKYTYWEDTYTPGYIYIILYTQGRYLYTQCRYLSSFTHQFAVVNFSIVAQPEVRQSMYSERLHAINTINNGQSVKSKGTVGSIGNAFDPEAVGAAMGDLQTADEVTRKTLLATKYRPNTTHNSRLGYPNITWRKNYRSSINKVWNFAWNITGINDHI